MLAADAIFVPDTKASTAGIHVAKVLQQLGIADEVAARLKIFPNGATAMRNLAASTAARPIGCTQSTEIIGTPGVMLSGSLPAGCELSTVYTAAVAARAAMPDMRKDLIDLLTAIEQRDLRERAGFPERGAIATRLPRRYLGNCVRPVGGPSMPVQPPSTNKVLPLT